MPRNSTHKFLEKTCKETVYITPKRVLERVEFYFDGQIPCDPATEPNNPTQAKIFYTKETNGLAQAWPNGVFINPPYGKEISLWTDKIRAESEAGNVIVALLPCGARFSTRYWQKDILSSHLKMICFVKGRIKFLRPDGTIAKSNPYDSAIYGFNTDKRKFVKSFSPLGKIIKIDILN